VGGRRGRVAKGHNSIWLSAHRKPIIPISNATFLPAAVGGRRGRVAKGHNSIWLSAHRKPIIPISNAPSLSHPSWTGCSYFFLLKFSNSKYMLKAG
jgi:hypothetical protein